MTVYTRTVSVYRSNSNAPNDEIGLLPASGRGQAASGPQGQTLLFSGVPCSIQSSGVGRTMAGLLPGNISSRPQWKVLTDPDYPFQRNAIRDNDIVVDGDTSYRYQVAQADWTEMGYKLETVRLET